MTTNVQNSCQCERFCAGTNHWVGKLFPGEHRGLVTGNDAAAFLYSLEVGLQDSCFPSFSSRLLVLLVLTEVSDSCYGHSHHHTSLLLWVENPEEIQARSWTAFSSYLNPSSVHYFAFLVLSLSVAKEVIMLVCQPSIAVLTTSAPGDVCLSWCGSCGLIWHRTLHPMSNLQLLSSRLCVRSETDPGPEQPKCIGACLNILA